MKLNSTNGRPETERENILGTITQIDAVTFFNKESDRNQVIVYALTDKGSVFEYLGGVWVQLNPLVKSNVKKFVDGKLV